MRDMIKRVRFCLPTFGIPSYRADAPMESLAITAIDGEVVGRLLVVRIPFSWISKNLGQGPTKIFAAAGRARIGIRRCSQEPEEVYAFFDSLHKSCGFIDPTFEIDEIDDGDDPMLLVQGETNRCFS